MQISYKSIVLHGFSVCLSKSSLSFKQPTNRLAAADTYLRAAGEQSYNFNPFFPSSRLKIAELWGRFVARFIQCWLSCSIISFRRLWLFLLNISASEIRQWLLTGMRHRKNVHLSYWWKVNVFLPFFCWGRGGLEEQIPCSWYKGEGLRLGLWWCLSHCSLHAGILWWRTLGGAWPRCPLPWPQPIFLYT